MLARVILIIAIHVLASEIFCGLSAATTCRNAPQTLENYSDIDFVIVSLRAMCSTELSLKRIAGMYQPRRIHYITGHPSECDSLRKLMNNDTRFSCLGEDEIFRHISTKASLKSMCESLIKDSRKSFGWHMQQFIKLGVARHLIHLSSQYVVFDADNILIYPYSLISDDKRIFLPYKEDDLKIHYEVFYKKTVGTKIPDRNYVIGHMVMEKAIVNEMLDVIDSRWNGTFPTSICNVAKKFHMGQLNTYFSEYFFYASWLKEKHPEKIASEYYWHPTRNPTSYQEKAWRGDCCVRDETICNSYRNWQDFYVIIEEHKFRYRDKVCNDGWQL